MISSALTKVMKMYAQGGFIVIYHVVMFLNCLLVKTGIFGKLLPQKIVLMCRLEWSKHYTHEFGEYVQTHEDPDITNTSHLQQALTKRNNT